jgi:hypothetical protein
MDPARQSGEGTKLAGFRRLKRSRKTSACDRAFRRTLVLTSPNASL